MKKKFLYGVLLGIALTGTILFAADHIDAPAVTGSNSASLGTDITDLYAFQSPADNSKMVFVINTQGLLSPSSTAGAQFPSNAMYELNIDNTGDNVEDLVIQCLVKNNKLRVYGPVAPATTGLSSTVKTDGMMTEATVTAYGATAPSLGMKNGIQVFAGPRDDPFFFDLVSYQGVLNGMQSSFNNPGSDTFAGTNVMSIVVEVPKSMLGSATSINVWAESKIK